VFSKLLVFFEKISVTTLAGRDNNEVVLCSQAKYYLDRNAERIESEKSMGKNSIWYRIILRQEIA
jgi:hypothetical protein